MPKRVQDYARVRGKMAIISFSRQFVFVKTAKTAGTSMEVCLSRHCAADDIVTPIFPLREDHQPRNFTSSNGEVAFFNHMAASQIRDNIGHERFATYFKFCFERHPVDKCLSHYAMLRNSLCHQAADSPKTWDEYVERGEFPNNFWSYTDETGALLVDKIYRYEDMSAAVEDIRTKTGASDLRLDVFEKAGWRTSNVPCIEDVTKPQRDRIMGAFSNSLQFVQYS